MNFKTKECSIKPKTLRKRETVQYHQLFTSPDVCEVSSGYVTVRINKQVTELELEDWIALKAEFPDEKELCVELKRKYGLD